MSKLPSRVARAIVITTAGLVAGGCMAREEGFVTDTLPAGTDTVTAPPVVGVDTVISSPVPSGDTMRMPSPSLPGAEPMARDRRRPRSAHRRAPENGAVTASEPDTLDPFFNQLRRAAIAFHRPETLFVRRPEVVSVVIAPEGVAMPRAASPAAAPDTTRLSRETAVCLHAPGFKVDAVGAEAGRTCHQQTVSFSAPSTWAWMVTATEEIRRSGPRPIVLTVKALVPGTTDRIVYTSTHLAYVRVGRLEEAQAALDPLKTLLATLAAIAAAVGVLFTPVGKRLRRAFGGGGGQ